MYKVIQALSVCLSIIAIFLTLDTKIPNIVPAGIMGLVTLLIVINSVMDDHGKTTNRPE